MNVDESHVPHQSADRSEHAAFALLRDLAKESAGPVKRLALAASAALTVLVGGCANTADLAEPADPTGLAAAVAELQVDAEHPRDGYDPDLFPHWIDADRDGCDTREEVLAFMSEEWVPGCDLENGRWTSAYDGTEVHDPSELDVDHVVSLAEAWDSGAHDWDLSRRREYANDLTPFHLLPATVSSNRAKGDRDPAQWLPDRDVCAYAANWVSMKRKWSLSVDPAERDALLALDDRCSPEN